MSIRKFFVTHIPCKAFNLASKSSISLAPPAPPAPAAGPPPFVVPGGAGGNGY